ncbi:MAG: TonB-dependent hemoglobin/transferrin/lactoferrin family receptor [Sideroxydans sp.]|nr:TonB-dependent hemoglobin/transferrin/lactoferrin family receptor [Sideroxydans sp.]
MFQQPTARRTVLTACLLAAFSAQAENFNFNLPAQDMAISLDALANQGHVRLLYSPEMVKGLHAPALSGQMSPEHAIAKLLEGSGLTWSATDGVIAVKVLQMKGMPASMKEVVVSATRTPNKLDRVPASVSLVTADDFSEQQAATVADVMKKLPNVDFGGGPRADGQIPTIRGDQFNNIILLVDGARRSSARVGDLSTPLFVDPYYLSRAEVVRGPTSTYGSGGLGGAMVFSTLSARDMLKEGEAFGGGVRAGYSSGNLSRRTNARMYGASGTVDFLLAGGYQEYSEIRQPGGITLAPNNGHDSSALAKVGAQAGDAMRVELSHKAYNKTAWETNNPQVAVGQVQMAHISQNETVLSFSRLNGLGEKATDVRIYDTLTKTQRDANTTYQMPGGAALPYAYSEFKMQTAGLSAQDTIRIDTDASGRHRLTYGLDVYRDKLNTLAGTAAAPNTPAVNPVNPDGSEKVQGVFVQDEITLAVWRIIPSLRYDGYTATPNSATLASNSNSHVSPKLAIAWEGMQGTSLYGSYGQAFRAPTVWEMFQNSPNPGFRRFAPNANLQPQTDTTLELGTRYENSRIYGNDDRLRLHAAIFQAKARNLIQSVTIAGVEGAFNSMLQYQNVANATKKGAELGGEYRIDAWKLNAGYSRIRITDDATGKNLFSPPDKLNAQVAYALPGTDMSVSWSATAVAAQDYDSTVLRQRSGYTVHDLFSTWQSPGQAVRVDFGITNLFDRRYLSYQQTQAAAQTAYEMGRSYNLSVSGSF